MVIKLDERPRISAGDTELIAVNYTPHLNTGELLTTPLTVEEQTTSKLDIENKVINTATYVEEDYPDDTVAVGKAVQFTVSGSTTGTYIIRITVSTTGIPARTFVRDVELEVS